MMAAMMTNREFDKKELGPVVLEYLARKMDRGMAIREKADPARFIDIQFNDFVDDSLATAKRIYEHFKLPMNDNVASRLEDYATAHPMNRHGKHEYALEEYGLDADTILDRFAAYLEKYRVALD